MNSLQMSLRWVMKRAATVCFGVAAIAGGCRTAERSGPVAPTRFDQLSRVYPALQSGRFLVIADFEDPRQMELVQLKDASERAVCVREGRSGRADTGMAGLAFTAASPDDAVVISNEEANQWYLKRDWRDYDLLLMSIRSPKRTLSAELTVTGGPPADRRVTRTTIPLHSGWTTLRLDLAQIGSRVPLDDIRELRLAVSGTNKPVEIHIDDILLAGNQKDLFGDSGADHGRLYVRQVGRRWRVGAVTPESGFEITFAHGQIVEWFNPAADPHRLDNKIGSIALGPTPVVVASSDAVSADFTHLGKSVAVRPWIAEMNAVRTVIASEWRFVDDPADPQGLERRPFQRWVYTVYPSGQVYVTVEATAEAGSWSASQLGLAMFAGGDVAIGEAAIEGAGSSSEEQPVAHYGVMRSTMGDGRVVFVPGGARKGLEMTESSLGGRPSVVVTRPRGEEDVEQWDGHYFFAPEPIRDEALRARAVDYATAAAPTLELGSFVRVSAAPGATPGFDAGAGSWVIAPDRGRVRLTINGGRRPRFSPAFTIVDAQNRQSWVYVNDQLLEQTVRDADGNLMFQVPGVVDASTVVEVLLRRE